MLKNYHSDHSLDPIRLDIVSHKREKLIEMPLDYCEYFAQ